MAFRNRPPEPAYVGVERGPGAEALFAALAADKDIHASLLDAAAAQQALRIGKVAVVVKSTRNALIGFVVLGFALFWAARGQADEIAPGARAKAAFIWAKFPKFVLGFLLISALATAAFFSKEQIGALANLSRWAFLLTFAGVGLRTNVKALSKQGLKPFLVGAIGEIAISGFTLALKSVNHRFLDLHMRMPSQSDALEVKLRRLLKQTVARGHLELTLAVDGARAAALVWRDDARSVLKRSPARNS